MRRYLCYHSISNATSSLRGEAQIHPVLLYISRANDTIRPRVAALSIDLQPARHVLVSSDVNVNSASSLIADVLDSFSGDQCDLRVVADLRRSTDLQATVITIEAAKKVLGETQNKGALELIAAVDGQERTIVLPATPSGISTFFVVPSSEVVSEVEEVARFVSASLVKKPSRMMEFGAYCFDQLRRSKQKVVVLQEWIELPDVNMCCDRGLRESLWNDAFTGCYPAESGHIEAHVREIVRRERIGQEQRVTKGSFKYELLKANYRLLLPEICNILLGSNVDYSLFTARLHSLEKDLASTGTQEVTTSGTQILSEALFEFRLAVIETRAQFEREAAQALSGVNSWLLAQKTVRQAIVAGSQAIIEECRFPFFPLIDSLAFVGSSIGAVQRWREAKAKITNAMRAEILAAKSMHYESSRRVSHDLNSRLPGSSLGDSLVFVPELFSDDQRDELWPLQDMAVVAVVKAA
jgi:hypothetical protein